MNEQQTAASTVVDFLQAQQERNIERANSTDSRLQSGAVSRGYETATHYGRAIYYRTGEAFQARLEEVVTGFILDPERAGPHYAAIPLLLWFSSRGMAPVAATALMAVLNQLSRPRTHRVLCNTIGRAVEDEGRAVSMFRRDSATATAVQKAEGKRGLISHETLKAFNLRGQRWERRDRFELGALLLDILLDSTPILVAKKETRKGKETTVLEASPWSRSFMDRPVPTTGKRPVPVPSPAPITVEPERVCERVRRRDDSPLTYLQGEALKLQAAALTKASHVPLHLDPWMVDVVKRCWEGGAEVFNVPPPATDTDLHLSGRERWIAERENRQHVRGQLKVDGAIRLMAELAPYKERIYLDHILDFRGRCYTNSGPISYQGPDFMKGCLQFALSGGELDLNEARMAAASHWGHGLDRASWSERLEWGSYHTIPMEEAAKDPMGFRWWMDADSPFQLLQVCRAISLYHQGQRDAFLPVRFDQTCSGVGHIAALTRNTELALMTNMIGDTRLDIYTHVAERVEKELQVILQFDPSRRKSAEVWLERGIDRSLMKRPVMSAVYGARYQSISEGFMDVLLAGTKLKHPADYERLVAKPASFLAKVTLEVMGSSLGSVFDLQKWMSKVVTIVNKAGHEVQWSSPSGMPCRLWSHRDGKKPVRTHLSGATGWWNDDSKQRATELSSRASGPGATANLIHSLDASVVHFVWQDISEQLLVTHDCFAVPCSVDPVRRLKQVLRRAVQKTYTSRMGGVHLAIWCDIADNARLQPAHLPAPPVAIDLSWNQLRLGENSYLFS